MLWHPEHWGREQRAEHRFAVEENICDSIGHMLDVLEDVVRELQQGGELEISVDKAEVCNSISK
jgi:hypothetical protein